MPEPSIDRPAPLARWAATAPLHAPPRRFHLSASGPWFAGLLALAILTFWPTYVSLPPAANHPYTHFHAMVATLWVLMLIAQPMLMRAGRMREQRALGRVSWVLAPVFIIAVLLLAHHRITTEKKGPDTFSSFTP